MDTNNNNNNSNNNNMEDGGSDHMDKPSESLLLKMQSNASLTTEELQMLKPPSSKNQIIKILVVDDDPITRGVLKKLLKNLGYEAYTASGSRKALELLMQQEFHLMLVDVMMPEMDGYSLIRVFKQASSREIPSIMMSGSEDPETVAKCFQCGAEDFLPKPIKEEILKARIQKCLDYRDRKIRERFYKELLNEEKRLKQKLTEQRDRNKEQLEEFKKKVSATIETPLQVVMETISDLMNGKYESEQYKVALITIMKSLSSSDLYRPAFVDYVQNASMDDSIREWLVNQYSKDGEDAMFHDPNFVGKRRKSKSEQSSTHRKPSFSAQPPGDDDNETLPFNLDEYKPQLTGGFEMNSTHYNSFDYTIDELKKHVVYMFKQLNLFEQFNFRPVRLWNLLEALKTKYKVNFYHNFRHAVDVTQYVYIFITSDKIKDLLPSSEKFMILTAALCHDVDHPGVNNNFLINTQDELALIYNDRSVLENHHAAYAFKLLSEPRYNILEGLDDEFYREFRRTVVNIILATDMANHFSICSKFQARISTGPLSIESTEDRNLLLKIIMKCADINNISRPFPIARKWANMCILEFLHQGDLEKQRNIPVSPLMDRDTLNFPKSQIGFADFVAAPLFKHVSTAFSNVTFMYNSIMYNRDQWQIIYDEAEKRQGAGAANLELLGSPLTPSSLVNDKEDLITTTTMAPANYGATSPTDTIKDVKQPFEEKGATTKKDGVRHDDTNRSVPPESNTVQQTVQERSNNTKLVTNSQKPLREPGNTFPAVAVILISTLFLLAAFFYFLFLKR